MESEREPAPATLHRVAVNRDLDAEHVRLWVERPRTLVLGVRITATSKIKRTVVSELCAIEVEEPYARTAER